MLTQRLTYSGAVVVVVVVVVVWTSIPSGDRRLPMPSSRSEKWQVTYPAHHPRSCPRSRAEARPGQLSSPPPLLPRPPQPAIPARPPPP